MSITSAGSADQGFLLPTDCFNFSIIDPPHPVSIGKRVNYIGLKNI